MSKRIAALAALLAVSMLIIVPAALADTANVFIGLSSTSSAPATYVASGTGGATYGSNTTYFNGFTISSISATGTPPLAQGNFLTNTVDVNSSGPGDLYVWITETGLTEPIGPNSFVSSFTSNTLATGWTADMYTYYTNPSMLWGTGAQLGTASFSGLGTSNSQTSEDISGTYSLTVLYHINASSANNLDGANLTANIKTPEPASMMLLGSGLLGLGGFFRRRVRK